MGNLLPSLGRRKLPMLEMPKVGGGGRGAPRFVAGYTYVPSEAITSTSVFTAPKAGVYVFHMSGAGGGGNYYDQPNGQSPVYGASSAGRALRRIKLAAGDKVTMAIGHGGTGSTVYGNIGSPNSAGGTTVITWPDGQKTTLSAGMKVGEDGNGNTTPVGGGVTGIYDEAVSGLSPAPGATDGANAPSLSVPGLTPGYGGLGGTTNDFNQGTARGYGAGGGSNRSGYAHASDGAPGGVMIFIED